VPKAGGKSGLDPEGFRDRLVSPHQISFLFWRLTPMIVQQSSGHFSREKGEVSVRHHRYFLMISQLKPGKRNFREK
jgi:hypothetical protein